MQPGKHVPPALAEPVAGPQRPKFQHDLDLLEAEVKEMAVLAR
jgi:hypothetical protein